MSTTDYSIVVFCMEMEPYTVYRTDHAGATHSAIQIANKHATKIGPESAEIDRHHSRRPTPSSAIDFQIIYCFPMGSTVDYSALINKNPSKPVDSGVFSCRKATVQLPTFQNENRRFIRPGSGARLYVGPSKVQELYPSAGRGS
jgi:hypothetical protein